MMSKFEYDFEDLKDIYGDDVKIISTFNGKELEENESCVLFEYHYDDGVWKAKIIVEFKVNEEDYDYSTTVFHVSCCQGIESGGFDRLLLSALDEESNDFEFTLTCVIGLIIAYVEENTQPTDVCPICREEYDESTIQLPCYHYFHNECIEDLKRSGCERSCPMCRVVFDESFVPHSSTSGMSNGNSYQMNDNIYSPSKSMSCQYFILIKNSGIGKNQSPHIFKAYMCDYKPISCYYHEEEMGWVVGFGDSQNATMCMMRFHGKRLLPKYPPMVITRYYLK